MIRRSSSGVAIISFLLIFSILLLLALAQAQWRLKRVQHRDRRPNIVLILADDLGYSALGCYGGEVAPTPRLDRLAREGLRLTDFHSAGTVCFPSRTGLLTGRYQRREGVSNNAYPGATDGLGPQSVTFPKLLQQAGYRTGLMGKWHQGKRPEQHPLEHGFDEFIGFLGGNIDYHSHINISGRHDWWHGKVNTQEEGYATDLITSHSLDFIRKNREKPFFLMVSHAAPHWPYQRAQDPPIREPGQPINESREQRNYERFPEMLGDIDRSVELILKEIDELGLADDTIVVFTSDNGPEWNFKAGEPLHSARPYRGAKSSVAEGGHRVPCLVRWRGAMKQGESRELISALDLAPTFLQAAGVTQPRDMTFDGRPLLSHFTDGETPPARPFYWEYNGYRRIHTRNRAVRSGDWKLHLIDGEPDRLYNLDRDPGEAVNLAQSEPDKVSELRSVWKEWFRDISAPSYQNFQVESEDFRLSNGLQGKIYRPVGKEKSAGIVLIAENSGAWLQQVAARLAGAGNVVLTAELSTARRKKLDWVDPLVEKMARMVSDKEVTNGWATFALGGGGFLAQRISSKQPLKGMIFYEAELPHKPEVPSLGLYSGTDHPALHNKEAVHVPAEIVLFEEAPVGFLDPGQPAGYDPGAQREAWQAIEEFVRLYLSEW